MNIAIIDKLRELKPILDEKFGIKEFAVFGSVAKGNDTPESDVDIAILEMRLKSGFSIINAKNYLEEHLSKPVDIGTLKSMKTFIKNRIEKDLIYV